ncbi:MAG TPA: cytochrome c oxidase subunit 3 [Acidimicrobiales bacterium]|nr:cytochrome c oxidase subunit 3 [Acidimicrobiales bacterium]
MSDAPLALTTGGAERPQNVMPLGMALMVSSGTMLFGTLIAAYLRLRTAGGTWPPKGVVFDEYLGNMLVLTMLLSVLPVEWACHAQRRNLRSQAATALGVAIGFGVAFLNLLSYSAGRTDFDAASHPYGLIVTALCMMLGIAVAVGVGMVTLTLFRVAGRQLTVGTDHLRTTAWYWHFTVGASVAVWYTVVVLK